VSLVFNPIVGLFFSMIPGVLACYCHKKLKSLLEQKNISVNILNIWMFKCMQVGLAIQCVINFATTFLQFFRAWDIYYKIEKSWFQENAWLSIFIISLMTMVVDLLYMVSCSLQVYEWFSIAFLINYEKNYNVESIMRSLNNANLAKNAFNKKEIWIRRGLFLISLVIFGSWVYQRMQMFIS